MRAHETEQTGGAGVSEVTAKFQRIGWGPVPNHDHDLGTDLLIQARDSRRFDRGLIVGAQVKAGDSYFAEPEDVDGEVVGWWYYEPKTDHFDDWVTHCLPHLLVLYDLNDSVAYWGHVTSEAVKVTGKGCKILVPRSQVVEPEQAATLFDVAVQQAAGTTYEGTAFVTSAAGVPPARRLRYALIAPRLVAPHANAGFGREISADEATALLMRGRFKDAVTFSDKHKSVHDPRSTPAAAGWGWHLNAAIWSWATGDDVAPLIACIASSPDGPRKAAATVLAVCALRGADRHVEARELLNGMIEADHLGPVDHGWALAHRAQLLVDLGALEQARADAAEAQRCFAGDPDDPTASALAASAAWLLYSTADPRPGDLGEALSAADTAVSWWRTQMIAWALDDAAEDTFKTWAEDRSIRLFLEDRESLNLWAAKTNAAVTADQSAWRAISSRAAKQGLTKASTPQDVANCIADLRASGDEKGLGLALSRLRITGPLESLKISVASVPNVETWTRTTARASFELLKQAGDLLEPSRAAELATVCADLVATPTGDLVARWGNAFWVDDVAGRALAALLEAGGQSAHQAAASAIVARAPISDLLDAAVRSMARKLDIDLLAPEQIDGLAEVALSGEGASRAALLRLLVRHGHEEAKSVSLERAKSGDLGSILEMRDLGSIPLDSAAELIESFDEHVRTELSDARRGARGFGGFPFSQALVVFNALFPSVASWDTVFELLAEPIASADEKRNVADAIARNIDTLDDDARRQLERTLSQIDATHPDILTGTTVGGTSTTLAVALGSLDESAAAAAVSQLAFGSDEERLDAVAILGAGHTEPMRPLLAALASDGRAEVRIEVARAVGTLVAGGADEPVPSLAHKFAEGEGTRLPVALLVGISRHNGEISPRAREIVDTLLSHGAATVRSAAEQVRAIGG